MNQTYATFFEKDPLARSAVEAASSTVAASDRARSFFMVVKF